MKKILIAIQVILTLLTTNVYAGDIPVNPVINPEYIEYLESGDGGDYRPPLITVTSPAAYESYELPEKYDARDDGKIHYSGVGQSTDGSCWAFASILCSETALGGNVNLSEQHARYSCSNEGDNIYGYYRTPSSGGNFKMFTAYAADWRGLVLEKDDPYVYGNTERDYETITAQKPVEYHLQETVEIPNPKSSVSQVTAAERLAHVNEVKYYVYTYGCCFSSMYWNASNFNSETRAYFSTAANSSNHAVNIIGWDDSYPKENFLTQPENDGAFIIKNSQGLTGSYFYLSYEDMHAGWDAAAVAAIEDKFNYGKVYSHQSFEPGAALDSTNGFAKTTNVYTSQYDGEYVSAVGILTKTRNLDYKIYLSKTADPLAEDETGYTLLASGNLTMPGYHTIKLDEKFVLGDKGTDYLVRVVYTSDGVISVPIEYAASPTSGMIRTTHAQPGESYVIHFSGKQYNTDISNNYRANAYVNAFTDGDYSITFDTDNASYSINGSEQKAAQNITAGLNDEITLEFPESSGDTAAFFVNDTAYEPGSTVILKITEDLCISEQKKADVKSQSPDEAITLDTCRKASDKIILGLTPQFVNENTVIAAFYSGNRLVGLKSERVSGTEGFFLTAGISESPDSVKIIVINSFNSLNTQFNVLHFDF